MPSCVSREWLTRRAPNKNLCRHLRVASEELVAGHIRNICEDETRTVIRLKREAACRVKVDACDHGNARLYKAVSQPARSAEQVDGGNS